GRQVQHAVAKRETQGLAHLGHAFENRPAPLGRQHVDLAVGMALFQADEQRLRHHHVANPTGTYDQYVHKLKAISVKLEAGAGERFTAGPRLPTAGLSDQRPPFGVRIGLAGDQVEVGLLQLLGDRAAAADADLATVELANRSDLGSGAGEEGLVGNVDLVAGDALLDDLDTQLARQSQHGAAGDAVQAGGDFRGVDHAVLDDEDVLAGAFGHVAFRIEQQRLVGTGRHRFLQRQHRVDIAAAGLGAGHGDVDVMPGEGAGADLDAFLQRFVAHVGTPVPGRYDDVHLEVVGADAHAFRSVEHQRTHVSRFEIVFAHCRAGRLVDLFLGERNLHAH